MNFYEIKDILFEPRFFELVAKVHKDVLSFENLAQYEYNMTEGSFNISLSVWLNSKSIDIGQVRHRIIEKFTEAIHTEWQKLDGNLKERYSTDELLKFQNEAIELKKTFQSHNYLAFSKSTVDLLDRAIKYSADMQSSKSKKAVKATTTSETTEIPPIKWNSGVGLLGTLIHDLTQLVDPKTGKKCMQATPATLAAFFSSCFVDENNEPFSEYSLKTYIDPNHSKTSSPKNKVKVSFEK